MAVSRDLVRVLTHEIMNAEPEKYSNSWRVRSPTRMAWRETGKIRAHNE